MRILQAIAVSIALLGLTACASVPGFGSAGIQNADQINTPEEVLAVAEISYQGVLRIIDQQAQLGNISPDQARDLIALTGEAERNLELARSLVAIGSDPRAAIADLNSILQALTILLNTLEGDANVGFRSVRA